MRKASNYLVSITSSAVTFYDGSGNAASNIVAQFGTSLARIGKAASEHIDITSNSLVFYIGNSIITKIGKGAIYGTNPNAKSFLLGDYGDTYIRAETNSVSSATYGPKDMYFEVGVNGVLGRAGANNE